MRKLILIVLVLTFLFCSNSMTQASDSKTIVGNFALKPGEEVPLTINSDKKIWVGVSMKEFRASCDIIQKNGYQHLSTAGGSTTFEPKDGVIEATLVNTGDLDVNAEVYTKLYEK